MKVRKFYLYIFLLQWCLFILLEISYVHYIQPHYSDLGFTIEFHPGRYLTSKILLILVLLLVARFSLNILMYCMLNMVISFFLVPNLILYQFMSASPAIIAGIISLIVFALVLGKFTPPVKFTSLVPRQQVILLSVVVIVLMVPFFLTFGLTISSDVFVLDVYGIREKSAQQSNVFTQYTYSLLSSWILPLCIIYGYRHKNYLLLTASILGLLYLFGITGNKITFFVIFVIICFLFFYSHEKKLIAMYAALISIFAIGVVFSAQIPQIQDLLIRRFLFLPALLNIEYHQFFEGSPVFYSHSFLSSFSTYPYELPPSQLIGAVYHKGENMTNGIVADGYLNLGTAGIFVHCFLAACIITFFSKMKIDALFLGLFFLLVQNFIDSAFFTSLLTHGLFAFMVLSVFLISNTAKVNEDAR